MRKIISLTVTILIATSISFSQKKPLDHSVYDNWKSLSSININDDGTVAATLISPQEGDTTLVIQKFDKKRTDKRLADNMNSISIEKVRNYKLSSDGKWTVGLLKAPFAERRQARIDKKKKEDAPKDSLVIINNLTFEISKIPDIKSYKTASEMNSFVTYTVELPEDTTKDKGSKKKEEVLVLLNLENSHEDTLRNVKNHVFSKFGNALVLSIEPDKKDSTDFNRVEFIDLTNNRRDTISREKPDYRSFSFDEDGSQLVYLATADTSKVEQKVYDIRYYTIGADSAIVLADSNAEGLPGGWIFNEHASPSFSKNGKRIIVGSAPKKEPKDTTIVEFEMAQLDIWHWQDPLVQPQQLVERGREERRTFSGIIYPDRANRYYQIANEEMPFASIAEEGNGRYALLSSNTSYLIESQWDLSAKYDVWVMDLDNGNLTEVAKPVMGRPSLSPQGNFVYWWESANGNWFTYDIKSGKTNNITEGLPVNFWDEKNDVPRDPGSYGIAGWMKDDEFILINDRFDIWKADPRGVENAENITQGRGRSDSLTFRYVNTDREKRFIESDELLLLSAFDNVSKESGYYTLKQSGRNRLQKRVMDKFSFSGLQKAKDADMFVFIISNFSTSPDLHVTNNFWQSSHQFTDINPQMNDYNWGSPELFKWTSFAGVPLEGIVYKPEDFDPDKKYPVMIYFYEQHSDNLYSYFTPAPSRSTVNIPFFVSRGYIVFTPDIHYTVGQPGMDAYNAVVAGAEALAENSWVDRDNMAIQGQSWGGYQVAYLVTKTDMFKAAGSGAPVSNMTSAYGGIRWESGRSRQYQYEQTQSRLGYTMNDSLNLYIDNSPVFFAENVNTPLLIMHNDNDGAVPWYQGIELFMSLRRLSKPVWMLQYNNEAHNLLHRRNTKDLSIRLQQFFDYYLKGEPAPVWMTRGVPATEKGKTWGYEADSSSLSHSLESDNGR